MSQNTPAAQVQPGRQSPPGHTFIKTPPRQTFVTSDGHRILVEASPTFLNVRVSVDNGEPIAIPCELVNAVAQALVLAGIAARRLLPPMADHPDLTSLPATALQPVQINEQTR